MSAPRYDLEDRLIAFAVQICVLAERFPATGIGRHVSSQIVRSGTSPFANYGEAQAAESRQDFVHKLRLCLKELRETQAWLKFAERMTLCPENIDLPETSVTNSCRSSWRASRQRLTKCRMSNVEYRISTFDTRYWTLDIRR